MSVTVARDKEVTVVTFTSDCKSEVPPLCQILKNLCSSSQWCSVYEQQMQPNVASALGAIEIMVGLFSIGLGPGPSTKYYYYDHCAGVGAAYWLGVVYITAGILSVFSARLPSFCLVSIAVFVNIVGLIFAIFGIVMYSIDLGSVSVQWMCGSHDYNSNCREMAYIAQRLLTAIDITMIVLTVLQLCVCISFAVLSIKAVLRK